MPILPTSIHVSKAKGKGSKRKISSKSIKGAEAPGVPGTGGAPAADPAAPVAGTSGVKTTSAGSVVVAEGLSGPSGPPQAAKTMDQSGSAQSSIAAQEDKAAKVAALSQALVCIDKFKKSQEEKEDNRGGPNASEMNDFATHLQEASQGAATGTGKSLADVLNKEQVSKGGDGFC